METAGSSARITLVHSGFGGDALRFLDYNDGWADYLIAVAVYLLRGENARAWRGARGAGQTNHQEVKEWLSEYSS